jgi:citrate lyase beta subunit
MHKIHKATTLGVDCICMDMEDGVALNRKPQARETIVKALRSLGFGASECLARINPVGSGLEEQDLQAVLPARPQGIVIPKVENASQIAYVENALSQAEIKHGWEERTIHLIVIVESALGILNLREIASASPRLQAIIFGAEDFAGDVGLTRTPESSEVFYARSAVVTHAAAFNLQAIDMVYLNFRDLEGLRREAERGAEMGFSGKQIIHPAQVGPVQEAFTPDDAAIAEAKRLLEAMEAHQRQGVGAFELEGRMIDAPLVKAAERVIQRARAAGKL